MLASEVITNVRHLINDDTGTRWPSAELLDWITAGLRAVANFKPQAVTTAQVVALTANSVRQPVPTGSFLLVDVVRNMGSDGITPGAPVRRVDHQAAKAFETTWFSATGETAITDYAYNADEDHDHFYVYPRTHASTPVYVEVLAAVTPVDVTDPGDTLPLKEDYLNVLTDYVAYRALSKDSEFADNRRALVFIESVAGVLGTKVVDVKRTRFDG